MVRAKNSSIPKKLPETATFVYDIAGELVVYCAAAQYQEMSATKCHVCKAVLNRGGERPGIRCKECKNEHCFKCAEVKVDFCVIVKGMGKEMWTCKECESKSAVMKAMLESMKLIKSELSTIKEGQVEQQAERAEQQAERAQILEGLKAVEAVAKKLDRIEDAQDKQEQHLVKHDDAILKNTQRCEEGEERLKKLEDQIQKFDRNIFGVKLCFA